MARRRILASMTALLASLPLALAPLPTSAQGQTPPVSHYRAIDLNHGSTPPRAHPGRQAVLPARPSDRGALTAAKYRVEHPKSGAGSGFLAAGSPCTSVIQTVSPASPQAPGAAVTFTASASGCASPVFKFWIQPPSGSWTVTQDYSPSASWTWNTTGLIAGNYTEDVYARDASSTAAYDTYLAPAPTYTLQTPTCASVTESASPASPQAPGTSVTFTAAASGCPNPNYKFWLLAPGGSWTVVQDFSATNTWTWNTTGLATGTYTLDVYARDATSTAAYDTHISPNPTYTLQAPASSPCTSVTESASPASPQAPGASVTFTATATGCANPNYKFWLLAPGGAWTVVQDYSASNTWTWNTTGLAAGAYTLDVYARNAGSTASYEAHVSPNPTYTLQAPASSPCTSVTESASPASPQAPGASVTFTATATGCANSNYKFWLLAPGGAWTVVQDFSASSTWTWNTTGLSAGTYTLDVYARDASSSAAYEAHISPNPTYALQAPVTPCASVSETASPASPQAPGTSVTFTATATGCPNPNYQFWLLAPGSSWTVVQAYSTNRTWTWSTTGLASGTYTFDVYTRDASSSATYDAHISPNPTYVLQSPAPPSCTAVTESANPPSPQAPGVTVTFTATASGCPNPTYKFWLLPPGGSWTVVQDYSAANTWTWNTSGAPGTYLLDVYVRQSGSTASYEAHISPNPSYRVASGWNGTNAPGVSAADETFCCVPPDTTGSIGPANYIEIINTTVAVYDRNLNLVASSDLASFSNAGGLNVSDPQMQYDPRSGRWLYSLVGFNSNFTTTEVLFGWSKTSSPTDLVNGWCRFSAPSGSMLPDYDKLGHDDNFILVGSNFYDMSRSSQPFVTAQIYAITKPAAGDTGCAAPTVYAFADSKHVLKNSDGTLAFTPVPANTSDASQGGFIVAAHSPTLAPLGPQTKIMAWHVTRQPSGNPALNADGDTTVSSFDVPAGVPQPGGAPLIDSLDARLTQAVAHADPKAGGAEAVWTQHTINGPGGRSVVRWYELLPATRMVRQQGQVAHATDYVFNGAVSPSIAGSDAVVVYDRGGASESPVVAGQGHSSSAALGALDSGETILAVSTGVDTDFSCYAPYGPPCRWGDYGGASPDPLNPGVVWATEEWSGPSSFGFPGWGTQNFALAT
ncbi:MAG TPA: hypothetical protein VJR46_06630 [Candidatus Dormibacteraeota bacterium]|nr:hypothetical protein [Candidatus Dormibacteraeota bacterium]